MEFVTFSPIPLVQDQTHGKGKLAQDIISKAEEDRVQA